MASIAKPFLAEAHTDAQDRLIEAQEPLVGLQNRCGGQFPGTIAIPELLALVRKSRTYGLRLARMIHAVDGENLIKAWAQVSPDSGSGDAEREAGGCIIQIANWQSSQLPADDHSRAAARKLEIDRATGELTARLDAKQQVLTVETIAADLAPLARKMRAGVGRVWTDFVEIQGNLHEQPMHWRLLDGSECRVEGSDRLWEAVLVPMGQPEIGSGGFELYLVSQTPFEPAGTGQPAEAARSVESSIGRDLSPVLRQPIARIIANAETIRTRLAGPLADEYSDYAADISTAGQHLLALIDDLHDLEVVESEDFSTSADEVDLADVARRAAGILGMRAQEREIEMILPDEPDLIQATAEFRRVLQVLLNLVGNAIRYSPRGSSVRIELGRIGDRVRIMVADDGPGLSDEQQALVFEKFERLGRSDDGGSGLGLYISRRIVRAMGGELSVESTPSEGACFIMELPGTE